MAVVAIGTKTIWPATHGNRHGFDSVQTHLREAGRMFDQWQWMSKPAHTVYLSRTEDGTVTIDSVEYRKDLLLAVKCCTAPKSWEWLWRL